METPVDGSGIPSPIDVQSWPQAIVMIALILAVMVVPAVIGYMNNRLVKGVKADAEEARDAAKAVKTSITENNGGGSVKDRFDRLEGKLDAHLDWSEGKVGEIDQRLAALEKPAPRKKRALRR